MLYLPRRKFPIKIKGKANNNEQLIQKFHMGASPPKEIMLTKLNTNSKICFGTKKMSANLIIRTNILPAMNNLTR